MPLVYQQNINATTKLAVWQITEAQDFFLPEIPLQRSIMHPHKRLQHLAGRLLLKKLAPDFPYELIRIADTRKPFLENEAYHFSISHCRDYAAAIISKTDRVGVDIEMINPKVEKVQHKFLNDAEQQILIHQSSILNIQMLTLAWSIKEVIYKWYGEGSLDFKEHIHIENIFLDEHGGKAECKVSKNKSQHLSVYFIFFEKNCLAWASANQ